MKLLLGLALAASLCTWPVRQVDFLHQADFALGEKAFAESMPLIEQYLKLHPEYACAHSPSPGGFA